MFVVTSGLPYIDIDAYAGCIAYADLLNLLGHKAQASSSAILNESITASLRNNGKDLVTYEKHDGDDFVIIDTSSVEHFDKIVDRDRIVEVIDHHPGHEKYWQERIGSSAKIEKVGAACTQVFEAWKEAGRLKEMDAATATLLAAGILDNTLNFTAEITTKRDHDAYAELKRIAQLGKDFSSSYFTDVQHAIESNLADALRNDLKTMGESSRVPYYFGQLVVWDGAGMANKDTAIIVNVMEDYGSDWGVNVVSISEGKSYFIAKEVVSQNKFTHLFGVKFKNGVSEPYKVMLRKEILKRALDFDS